MIYVTGDLHGEIERFRSKPLRRLKKNDTLIVCGDFGFLWNGSPKEKALLKWIGKRRYQVLFVEGIHDNLELIKQYPETTWNGGKVREISGKLKYLCRGQVYNLQDTTIFTFGGGESSGEDFPDDAWWVDKLPTQEELSAAWDTLARYGNCVDYIITHQCSRQIKQFLAMDDKEANVLDTFLDQVRSQCRYKRWFFGSYHINKVVPPMEMALYNAVTPITSGTL